MSETPREVVASIRNEHSRGEGIHVSPHTCCRCGTAWPCAAERAAALLAATAPTPDEVGQVEGLPPLPCVGCGSPLREIRTHVGAVVNTCDHDGCYGNLNRLAVR